jgi:hypothetical protein
MLKVESKKETIITKKQQHEGKNEGDTWFVSIR